MYPVELLDDAAYRKGSKIPQDQRSYKVACHARSKTERFRHFLPSPMAKCMMTKLKRSIKDQSKRKEKIDQAVLKDKTTN